MSFLVLFGHLCIFFREEKKSLFKSFAPLLIGLLVFLLLGCISLFVMDINVLSDIWLADFPCFPAAFLSALWGLPLFPSPSQGQIEIAMVNFSHSFVLA